MTKCPKSGDKVLYSEEEGQGIVMGKIVEMVEAVGQREASKELRVSQAMVSKVVRGKRRVPEGVMRVFGYRRVYVVDEI
jgi:hypothetical protein